MIRAILILLLGLAALTLAASAQAAQGRSRIHPNKKAPARTATRAQVDRSTHNLVKEDGQTVVYRKKTEVDFDDSLIEGEVKNPSEFYFVHRPEQKYPGLVKKRPNFHKEMLRDSVMIR